MCLKNIIFLNLLRGCALNNIVYIIDENISKYEKAKAIALKKFEPMQQVALKNFKKAPRLN